MGIEFCKRWVSMYITEFLLRCAIILRDVLILNTLYIFRISPIQSWCIVFTMWRWIPAAVTVILHWYSWVILGYSFFPLRCLLLAQLSTCVLASEKESASTLSLHALELPGLWSLVENPCALLGLGFFWGGSLGTFPIRYVALLLTPGYPRLPHTVNNSFQPAPDEQSLASSPLW